MQCVYTGLSEDGRKAMFNLAGKSMYAFPGRAVEDMVKSLAPNTNVDATFEQVPRKDGMGHYNRVVAITPGGAAPPASMKQVGTAAPHVQPGNDQRDEMIFVCGVVNNYVRNTGDTSVSGLVAASQNARQAFRVVMRGERVPDQFPGDLPDSEKMF